MKIFVNCLYKVCGIQEQVINLVPTCTDSLSALSIQTSAYWLQMSASGWYSIVQIVELYALVGNRSHLNIAPWHRKAAPSARLLKLPKHYRHTA
jgi:hypothetical protein